MSMKEKSKELKLRIELVPSTSWYNNLRKVLPDQIGTKYEKKLMPSMGTDVAFVELKED